MIWAALIPALLSAGTSLAGAAISSSANSKAAETSAAAQDKATQIQIEAVNKYIAALQEGLDIQEAALRSGYDAELAAINQGSAASLDAIARGAAGANAAVDAATQYGSTAIDRAAQESTGAVNYGYDQQRGAIVEGNEGAQQTYGAMRVENAPGLTYLRTVVADPMSLTAEQRYEIEKTREAVGKNIRASGFAGSGRTAAAMMQEVETDSRNSMIEANRRAALDAASMMAGTYNQAGAQVAGLKDSLGRDVGAVEANRGERIAQIAENTGANRTNLSTWGADNKANTAQWQAGAEAETNRDASVRAGSAHSGFATNTANTQGGYYDRLGNAYLSIGKTQADGTTKAADTKANAQTANGEVWGTAIGDIGSAIATANRSSRYSDAMKAYEKSAGIG